MSGIMSSIGNIGTKVGGYAQKLQAPIGLALGVPSLISQLGQAKQQKQYLDQMLSVNKQYADQVAEARQRQTALFNMDPSQMSREISNLVKPLDASLVSRVSNPVQAYLAERGLTQAPGIQTQTITEALAPYAQQNMQNAIQSWFNLKQLPFYVPQPQQPQQPQFPQSPGFKGILDLIMGGLQRMQQARPANMPMSLPNPRPIQNYPTMPAPQFPQDYGNIDLSGLFPGVA